MAQTRWEADFEERALASYLPYVEGGGRQFGLLPGRGRRGGPGKDPRGNGPGGLGHQTQEEMKETMGGGGGGPEEQAVQTEAQDGRKAGWYLANVVI